MRTLAPCLLALALTACATPDTSAPSASATSAAPNPHPATAQITDAATAPLSDLNLVRADIPEVLHAARHSPYGPPSAPTCAGITADVQALDAVLGADLDTPPTASNPGMLERGAGAVGNAAVGALRGAAEGVVPFRSWVRKLTGAERYSRDVAAAIAAGTIRRAFLKGLGQSLACEPPAAPRV